MEITIGQRFPDALPRACIAFIERKRDSPFFAVPSFVNPHDIWFAYKAYKRESPKSKASVEHHDQQAAALPLDKLPPLPDNFRIPVNKPDAIEFDARPSAVTMRKEYDERPWRIYRWIYCRLTEQVDKHLGQILDDLKRNGLEEETLIIFTTHVTDWRQMVVSTTNRCVFSS